MRIHVVADVHGNFEALARAGEGADQLMILGDLLDYVDYHDPSGGIMGAVFGAEKISKFVAMRTVGAFAELHAYNHSLWSTIDNPAQAIIDIVSERYQRVIEVIPDNTLLTLGNVDVAQIWSDIAPPNLQYLDGEVRTIGGLRFGFVAGGSSRPGSNFRRTESPWQPFVRSALDYLDSVAAVTGAGSIDILCSHIPPNLFGMRYDMIPARLEMYGPGLLQAIDLEQPSIALSGHVHQPLMPRVRRGRTECINVGHFQRFGQPYVLDLERVTFRAWPTHPRNQ